MAEPGGERGGVHATCHCPWLMEGVVYAVLPCETPVWELARWTGHAFRRLAAHPEPAKTPTWGLTEVYEWRVPRDVDGIFL